MKQLGLFGADAQLQRVTELGDNLVEIKRLVDWEMFRKLIEGAIRKDMSKGGRPPYDALLMFKITMLQGLYGLSDPEVERQINDRRSFMRFLDLEDGESVPDKNTVWNFRQAMLPVNLHTSLFDMFLSHLRMRGLIVCIGSIVDASFAHVPIRHTTNDDNQRLKAGELPTDLIAECIERLEAGEITSIENVLAQTDTDARWTKKNDTPHFGYKAHAKCDSDSKIVTALTVTDAAVHDSQQFVALADEYDQVILADSAYGGQHFIDAIHEFNPTVQILTCTHRKKNQKTLTDEQKAANKAISTIRARIEHIFGYIKRFMGGLNFHSHGLARITRDITLKFLAYNIKCFIRLIKQLHQTT